MPSRAAIPRLHDILEAVERIRSETTDVTLDEFEADWRKRWLVERGIEINPEASRHLPAALKARHPQVPWRKVAGVGNVLRHEFERIAPDVLWHVARDELSQLEHVCRTELAAAADPKD